MDPIEFILMVIPMVCFGLFAGSLPIWAAMALEEAMKHG